MTEKKRKKAMPLCPTADERLLGWTYLAVELVVLPGLIQALGSRFGGFSDAVANFLFYLTNALCCGLIFRKLLRQSLIRAGQEPGVFIGWCAGGFLLLLGANQLLTSLAMNLRPEFVNLNNAAISAMVKSAPLLMTLGTVILVPVGEECLFRGLLFLAPLGSSRRGAYALSVLAFSAIHVAPYLGQGDCLTLALCFSQYIPAGLVLAAVCERTGSLLAPMLIHGAINACSILFLN